MVIGLLDPVETPLGIFCDMSSASCHNAPQWWQVCGNARAEEEWVRPETPSAGLHKVVHRTHLSEIKMGETVLEKSVGVLEDTIKTRYAP